MINLDMENYNTMLVEKHQEHQHHCPEKLINTNILQANNYCHLLKVNQRQPKFTYSSVVSKKKKTIGNRVEKQTLNTTKIESVFFFVLQMLEIS